jgi:acetyltransferase
MSARVHGALSPAVQSTLPPYPAHLARQCSLNDGTIVTIRPIRPEDAGMEQEFVRRLSAESRYFRFMDSPQELSPRMLSHFTQIDYDLHMAFIAVTAQGGGRLQVGVARYIADNDRKMCEFAVVVADDWQKKGIGALLMQTLVAAARAARVRVMFGDVLSGNDKMLRLAARLGFSARVNEADPRLMRVEMNL